jgi:ribosomal protein L21
MLCQGNIHGKSYLKNHLFVAQITQLTENNRLIATRQHMQASQHTTIQHRLNITGITITYCKKRATIKQRTP